jgi:hypothetical protein
MSFYFDGTSNLVIGGNLGIGTTIAANKLTVFGDVIVGTTTGNTNQLVPSASGKINGVSITALNKRTRASYASAVNAVSTWTTRASATNNDNRGIAWAPELGLFCAVASSGTGNRVMTSPDGINWVTRTSAADNQWYNLVWAPQLCIFCAVAITGTGNRVMTSTDGITWTTRTSAADNEWYGIEWAPELNLFCATAITGTGNRVMTSTNGITWVTRTSPADNSWRSVVWAPELGIFAAVATIGTSRVMTSPDGITWTTCAAAVNNQWVSITWAPELGIFCATAANGTGNRVMTSPDGITWTTRTNTGDYDWYGLAWAPELSLFCATGTGTGTGSRVMTSPDGITWTTRTSAADNNWNRLEWAPELSIFCAVSATGTGNRVMTSKIALPAPKSALLVSPAHMTVDGITGSVGIGTTNPSNLLALGTGGAAFPTPSGSAPLYACRAWVNFDGTGTGTFAVRASGNVSDITKINQGRWTVNFTTSMPDRNYSVTCTGAGHNSTATVNSVTGIYSPSANYVGYVSLQTTYVQVQHQNANGALIDPDVVCVSVFR